jgi:hypothetical protein
MPWNVHHARAIEQGLRHPKRRPGVRSQRRRLLTWIKLPFLIVVGVLALYLALAASPTWPLTTRLKHIAAAPNCDAARAMGLAPARRGQPGYYSQHDRDKDGIACEPWPPRRRTYRRWSG